MGQASIVRQRPALCSGCSQTRGIAAISAKCASLRLPTAQRFLQNAGVQANSVFEAEVQGIGNQGMTNGDFVEPGNMLMQRAQIGEVQIVSCIDQQPQIGGNACCIHISSQQFRGWYRASIMFCIGLRVEFHRIKSELDGPLGMDRGWINEGGNSNTGCLKLFNQGRKALGVHCKIPTVIRGQLGGFIRHQGDLLGPDFQHQVHEGRFVRIPFDVEFGLQATLEQSNIVVSNMTGIRSWMNGDAIRPETLAIQSNGQRIGDIPATAVAKEGDFVDVDAKPGQSEKLSPQAQDRAAFGLLK